MQLLKNLQKLCRKIKNNQKIGKSEIKVSHCIQIHVSVVFLCTLKEKFTTFGIASGAAEKPFLTKNYTNCL